MASLGTCFDFLASVTSYYLTGGVTPSQFSDIELARKAQEKYMEMSGTYAKERAEAARNIRPDSIGIDTRAINDGQLRQIEYRINALQEQITYVAASLNATANDIFGATEEVALPKGSGDYNLTAGAIGKISKALDILSNELQRLSSIARRFEGL